MSCVICKKTCEPWLLLKNENIYTDEENKPIGQTIQTCGYSCCRKLYPKLPNKFGNLILNKEDFCYWAVPVLPKKKEKFEILTYEEIQKMTYIQKENYYKQKDHSIELDTQKMDLYNELEMEDMNTYCIENFESTTSESDYDDY